MSLLSVDVRTLTREQSEAMDTQLGPKADPTIYRTVQRDKKLLLLHFNVSHNQLGHYLKQNTATSDHSNTYSNSTAFQRQWPNIQLRHHQQSHRLPDPPPPSTPLSTSNSQPPTPNQIPMLKNQCKPISVSTHTRGYVPALWLSPTWEWVSTEMKRAVTFFRPQTRIQGYLVFNHGFMSFCWCKRGC